MDKKIVVAVIDSGVEMSDKLIANQEIKEFYYDNKQFKERYSGKKNMHGTEIIKVLLRESPDIRIISIQTLQEDNRCTLSSIIDSIEYCINIGVDIINLSLGSCTKASARIEDLKSVCELATDKGIVIFAADNNNAGLKAYPANFDNVICINTQEEQENYCEVKYENRTIEFSDSYVFVPDEKKCIIRKGNSYLSPMLVGIFCRFIGNRNITKEIVRDFFEFLEKLSSQTNIEKIFVDKKKADELNLANNKNMLFFADSMDFNNRNLYEYYKKNNQIEWCFKSILEMDETEIIETLKTIDLFYIGVLSNRFMKAYEDYLKRLFELLISYGVNTVMVLPFVSTYERFLLTRDNNKIFRSVYK